MSKIIGITAASNYDVDKIKKGADIYEVSSPEEIAADSPDGFYAVPNGGATSGGTGGGTGCYCDTTELEQDIAELRELHNDLEEDFVDVRNRVIALEVGGGGTGDGGTGDTTGLQNAVIKNTVDIAEHDQLIDKNARDITGLQTTVSGHTTQINSLGSNLTQTQRELDQLEMKLNTFDGVGDAFMELQNDLDEVERKVGTLEDFRESTAEAFDDLSTRVGEVGSKVTSLEIFRDSYEGNFDDLSTQVNENTRKISLLSGEQLGSNDLLDQLLNDVAENTHRSSGNELTIDAMRIEIDQLSETTLQHTAKLLEIAPKVERIDEIDYRVADIENGYRDNIKLKGANGNTYKLTIDASGSLVVTEV